MRFDALVPFLDCFSCHPQTRNYLIKALARYANWVIDNNRKKTQPTDFCLPRIVPKETLIKRGGLNCRSQMLWASRSVWHDRHVGIVEVPGSNPGSSTNDFSTFKPCKRLIANFMAFSHILDAFKPISYAKFANSGFNSIVVLI